MPAVAPGPTARRDRRRPRRRDAPADAAGRLRAVLRTAAPAAVVAVAVLACFLPAVGNGFVLWDDDLNVTDNPAFRGLSPAHLRWMLGTLHGGHWQPLTWLTLALDHAVWGLDPAGYHLTSVALHVVTAVLVWRLVQRLLRAAGAADGAALAWASAAGALAFGIHPLRVESVAWVSERRDVLCGVLYVSALLAYLRHAGTGDRRWLAAAVCATAASLLAKAWAITLPAVLLVLDVYPLGRLRRESPGRLLLEKLPFAALAVPAAALAALAQAGVPEMRGLAEHGLAARVAQAAYGLLFYPVKTLAPVDLSPAYLLEPRLVPTAPRYLLSALAVGGVTAILIRARRRWPWALAAWACYAVVLSPVLGLAQTGPQLVADRYSYLAGLPAAALAAAAVARVARHRPGLAGATAVAVLAVLGALTVRQVGVWRDTETLWTHAVRLDPSNWIAYTNRGWGRQLAGDLELAIADYTAAVAVHPGYALAYYNRGTARDARGDHAGALADYTRVIALTPGDARGWANRGWVREETGDRRGATEDYERALAIAAPDWPHRPLVERNLARVRAAPG